MIPNTLTYCLLRLWPKNSITVCVLIEINLKYHLTRGCYQGLGIHQGLCTTYQTSLTMLLEKQGSV